MPHQVAGRHLGRTAAERRSLFRNLMTDLFRYDRIRTTEAKAKSIRSEAEKLITRAKRGEAGRLVALAVNGNPSLSPLVGAPNAEKLMALAQAGETAALEKLAAQLALHARRMILKEIHDKAVVDRLIHEIAATHMERPGGYTRIIHLGPRAGDAAEMVFLEIVA